ncbi:MAG: hypothetical protein CMH30_08495 [Micavibrio sp.]|nr:hypothetical protein [Micavibrio sp.]|tara:strand:- start:389 stop:1270 length:882 start_codon:yes stop_codon:yes gene_type:complete
MPETRYDLPLAKDSLSQFQLVLTCIMTVLSLWVLAGFLMLSDSSERWTASLQNSVLIEIPAREDAKADPLAHDISILLKNMPHINKVESYKKKDIQELIKPWMDSTDEENLIDYPRFISVTLNQNNNDIIKSLEKQLKEIDETIVISQNKDQLQPLFSMIDTTRMVAGISIVMLFGIILLCISFAVRARMRMFKDDIEILYILGAANRYIGNQFQRQSFIIGLKGAFLGLFFGGGSMLLLMNFWPNFYTIQQHAVGLLSLEKIALFLAFPISIAVASALMARHTAHSILSDIT